MRFQVLDLERDPQAQGLAPASFDVIIASNVIHATADLRRTLTRVRRLLAPGGLLSMLEVTAPQRWFDLTVGLTEGWWAFSDTDLRPDYATLPRERWFALLAECGFDALAALPRGDGASGALALQSLLLARAATSAAPSTRATGCCWPMRAASPRRWRRGCARAAIDARWCVRATPTAWAATSPSSAPRGGGPSARAGGSARCGTPHARRAARLVARRCRVGPDDAHGVVASRKPHGAVSATLLAQALVAESPTAAAVDRHARRPAGRCPGCVARPRAGARLGPGQGARAGAPRAALRAAATSTPQRRPARSMRCWPSWTSPASKRRWLGAAGERRVARLASRAPFAEAPTTVAARATVPARAATPGSLDASICEPIERRAPGPGEVEIAVEATGLNFKDVLNVLGMYPGDPGPLGGECAGRVSAVGAGVTHVRPGDDVLAVAGGQLRLARDRARRSSCSRARRA